MPINPISAVQGVTGTGYIQPTKEITNDNGANFGNALTSAIDNLQQVQDTSKDLTLKAVTGDLTDIHQASIASARAAVTLELVASLRNKGVDAFTEIMRMQA